MSLAFRLSVLVFFAAFLRAKSVFEDCPYEMSRLEEALYQTRDNIFELNRVFYPPSMRTSRFIRVTYTFLDRAGADDSCNVTYIWAIGGFLFFQPPSVFELNSLFFNYPNNNLTNINVKLPYNCRPLINIEHGNRTMPQKCSCLQDSPRLDILTQQLNIYAKYLDRAAVVRENTFARAVCSEELHDIYYDNKNSAFDFILLCSTIFVPFFIIFLLLSVVTFSRVDDSILNSFAQANSHPSLVATVFTGTMISVSILVVDSIVCYVVANGQHEYNDLIRGSPINLYIVYGTLVCNVVFFLPLLFCLVYITVFNLLCGLPLPSFMDRIIRVMVGQRTFDLMDDDIVAVMFPLMMITPILCISSHLGYILLAWLTEPSKATTTFLIYYMIIFYCYIVFKRCYISFSRFEYAFRWRCKRSQQETFELIDDANREKESDQDVVVPQLEEYSSGLITSQQAGPSEKGFSEMGDPQEGEQPSTQTRIEKKCGLLLLRKYEGDNINKQAFCLLLFYGVFIVASAAIIILTFVLLPFSSEQLITYVFQLLQLIVVLVSTQIAYALLFDDSFSLRNIVKKFKEVFAKKGRDDAEKTFAKIAQQNDKELSDVAGEFAAELTDAIIRKLKAQ